MIVIFMLLTNGNKVYFTSDVGIDRGHYERPYLFISTISNVIILSSPKENSLPCTELSVLVLTLIALRFCLSVL